MSALAQILIVDDDPGVRFFLEEALTRDGYEVVAVDCGQAALDTLRQRSFELALLDLKLRDMDGTEVLEALHRDSPFTSAIILTGHGTLESAVQALRRGAHDYLFKPCKTVELRESIRTGLLKRQQALQQQAIRDVLEHYIGKSGAGPATIELALPTLDKPSVSGGESGRFLHYGQIVIDFAKHIITLDGHLLELSPTEFDLLAYLVTTAPRVVSQAELVREVQGYDTQDWDASETLRYHIYRLRQKIRQTTGRSDIIQTMRGVGYSIPE